MDLVSPPLPVLLPVYSRPMAGAGGRRADEHGPPPDPQHEQAGDAAEGAGVGRGGCALHRHRHHHLLLLQAVNQEEHRTGRSPRRRQ